MCQSQNDEEFFISENVQKLLKIQRWTYDTVQAAWVLHKIALFSCTCIFINSNVLIGILSIILKWI